MIVSIIKLGSVSGFKKTPIIICFQYEYPVCSMFMFEKARQKITTITSANDLMKFTETYKRNYEEKISHTSHIISWNIFSFESRQIEYGFKLNIHMN